ncbi:MAG TPA: transporter substrate-binding domain-containing protein [Azonexus sp.]|nr:transporter substrate-binding domain-containing protein [Azonexus sp.]
MIKTLVILLAVLLMGASLAADASESMVYQAGSEQNFRPYAFTDSDGQPTGFGPELLRAVAREMDIPLQITPGPWDTLWRKLVAGKLDVLPVVARTAGREPLVDFGLPHTETFDAFFVRQGHPPIKDLAAAAGKKIAVLRSDAAHHQLLEHRIAATVIPVDSIAEGLRQVAAGKYDAMLCSKVIGVLERQEADIQGVTAGPLIPDYKRTFSFAVRKGNTELLEKLDQGLRIIKASGEYERIYRRWLGGDLSESAWWQKTFWQVIGMLGVIVLIMVTGIVTRQALRMDRLQVQNSSPQSPRTFTLAWAWRYALAFLAVTLGGIMYVGLSSWAGSKLTAYVTFYPAILIAALLGGIGPGLFATFFAGSVLEIWILPPPGELAVISKIDQIQLLMFASIGVLMTAVAELSRRNRAKAAAFDRAEALKASEERYRQVVENAMDGIFLADLQGRYQDVNSAGAAMLGYSREEICQLSIADVIAPEDKVRLEEEALRLAGGGPHCSEWKILRRDGSTFVGEVVGRRLPNGRLLGILRDVSERNAMQEALANAKETADRANRAKSVFLANMSHEMRTPLNAIIGLSHLLRGDLDGHPASSRIDQLITASDHLMGLINDVLEFSRIEAGQLVLDINDFCLDDVLKRVVEVLAWPARNKLLQLETEIAADLRKSSFRGDALRLAQVLINLGGNAVKFTDYGSVRLIIEAGEQTAQGTPLQFTVTDTGIGISVEDQQRLFAPFSQVVTEQTRDKGGSGLGLVISQQIVTAMGGRIDVVSIPGTGSSFGFEIVLPPATGQLIAVTANTRRSFSGRRILMAEDDLLSQEIFFEMLENLGCAVEVASDGSEAVELARGGDYDLILMDMRMPRMDGLTAATTIRGLPRHRHTPIVALSANAFGEDRARCLEAGMDGHVAKPVTPERLAAALSQWIPEISAPAEHTHFENSLSRALRDIPCLDIDERRWQGADDVQAYFDLLKRFVLQGQEQMEALRHSIAEGNLPLARDIAHQLKGIAGLLKARTIADLALRTETSLRLSEPLAAVTDNVAACGAALLELTAALGSLSATDHGSSDEDEMWTA